MRIVFGNWKYLFKNFWYVLVCGLVPAIFLALTFDYTAIAGFVHGVFNGNPRTGFLEMLRAFALVRIDSALGGIYTVFAYIVSSLFAALMLSLVEKHMRIGKRTFSGVGTEMKNLLLPVFLIVFLFYALGELAAIILAALLFAIFSISSTALVYILAALAFLFVVFIFLYAFEAFYLWLPCLQITGFRPYHAFLYSYRLSIGVRWKLIAAHALSLVVLVVALGGISFLPEIVFRAVALVLTLFLYSGLFIRMETVYFETDKLDREDVIKSYKDL
ncbi:MAG: hypothetical protein K2L02_02585 [Clostridia bacterium]|nr:hypothetical protein [Clostridia bacterium]